MNIQKLNGCIELVRKDLGDGLESGGVISTKDGQLLAGTDNVNVAASASLNRITNVIREALKSFPVELGQYYYMDIAGNIGILVIPMGDYQFGFAVNNKKVKLGLLLNIILPRLINAFEDTHVSD